MKKFGLILLLPLALVACKKEPMEVTSTETRALSTRDGEVTIDATSAERFGLADSPQADALTDQPPADWKSLPPNMFRLKNYTFGNSGEVYLSKSAGTILDNTNRWLGQFEAEKLTAETISSLPTVDFLGTKAVWVEAQGTYNAGMGKPAAADYALAGAIAEINGAIYTVKMVGPKAEVEAQKEALRNYLPTVKIAE